MLKVLAVVDKEDTAIDRLAQQVKPYHDNFDYQVIAVHPKRPDATQLETFEQLASQADIIHYEYFRTAEMLRSKYDLKDKPSILSHYNPYSIQESDWSGYDIVVAPNRTIHKELSEICETEYVPITADPEFWQYNVDWTLRPRVLMVANRIESKKGILEVATACDNLGYQFVLVGNISDSNYFHAITKATNIEFHQKISDEDLRNLYYTSGIVVCNSIDGFESGTMPILESMLCGTPVLSRPVGHVPDLGENILIHEGYTDDLESIEQKLKEFFNKDKKELDSLRDKAWNSAKNHSSARRAYAYQLLYRRLMGETPVSIILPVCEKPEITKKCLEAIASQDYKNIEVVVADDSKTTLFGHQSVIEEWASTVPYMVRYLFTGNYDYGLARARNEAAIEATGDLLIFCDQRILMAPDAVRTFVDNTIRNKWTYGSKDGVEKDFVENFSAVFRTDFLRFGGFNERMKWYGGLSQETRHRLKLIGMKAEATQAQATTACKSSNRNRKRQDIIKAKDRLFRMGF